MAFNNIAVQKYRVIYDKTLKDLKKKPVGKDERLANRGEGRRKSERTAGMIF